MSPIAISGIVLLCICGGTILGIFLRAMAHERHLSADSKETVKLAMGLIATMSALVLGLLIASAKSSFDAQRNGLAQMAANVIMLDRNLAYYGPEAKEVRETLKNTVTAALARVWPEGSSVPPDMAPTTALDVIYAKIQELTPKTEAQRTTQAQALKISSDIAQTRWLLFAQRGSSIPTPFLVVLIFWVTILFASFTLFAPPSPICLGSLFVCALSVAAAIFLILELDRPFVGMIQIPSAPLRDALAQLGR